jgi:hypothetical protein
MGKALNTTVKEELEKKRIQGIKFPKSKKQRLITQYANDTNFTFKTTQDYVARVATMLDLFCQAYGSITINLRCFGSMGKK